MWLSIHTQLRLRLTVFDLPSDLYSIIKYAPLLPIEHAETASYEPVGTRHLPDGQESTVTDICDFIVEYINSDVLVIYFVATVRGFPLIGLPGAAF